MIKLSYIIPAYNAASYIQKTLDGKEPPVPMPLALQKMPIGKHDAGLHAGRPELKVALDAVPLTHAGHPRGVYAPLLTVILHTYGEIDLVKLSMIVAVEDGPLLVFGSGSGAVDGDDAMVEDGNEHGGSFQKSFV